MKIPSAVAVNMPKTTVVPISLRETLPAPVESANGKQPKINANEVIKIGRKRILEASMAALT